MKTTKMETIMTKPKPDKLERIRRRLSRVETKIDAIGKTVADLSQKNLLYWAYGANLNVVAMRRRCPDAKKVGRLILPHGQLTFRGVADVEIVDDPAATISGGLWEISRIDEANLDIFEGVKQGVYAKRYMLLRFRGEERRCMFYKMSDGCAIDPPYEHYYDTIAGGYSDFDLDKRCLEEALARSWADSKKDRR